MKACFRYKGKIEDGVGCSNLIDLLGVGST